MGRIATLEDKRAIEAAMPWSDRVPEKTVYQKLQSTAREHGDRPAISFQIKSGPKDKAETLSWSDLRAKAAQAANLFRRLGVHEGDGVAFLLPNANETVITLFGGMTAGKVCPINPTLSADRIGQLLRESGAKVLVTLAPFPKSEVADLAAEAVAAAPNVETVLTVDLKRYLSPPLSWIVPLIRPKPKKTLEAKVLDFNAAIAEEPTELTFTESEDLTRVVALFHTGGTTGMPKMVQHTADGTLYNGWVGNAVIVGADDVLICPLPLFHVFAVQPILMSALFAGAHVVFPTPAGYRGDGVMDNFWSLVERWGVTFMVMVPTAASALMQRPVNADVSSLRSAFCGSAPLPVELFKRFEAATGVKIIEGYGMSETTCLISGNPPEGEPKIGSVGYPFPYTRVRILDCDPNGTIKRECDPGEIGEICISSPGVFVGHTYSDVQRNAGLYADGTFLRTGDLGKIDADGYLWITGRAKDLIIRGGHNIDPAIIEEAMLSHPAVAFAGAIGQPDAHSGELPCVYVELIDGETVEPDTLMAHAADRIPDPTAVPKYVEILEELPKTAVGKVFKPDIRKSAITRIYNAALEEAGVDARVHTVREDKERGLVAEIERGDACDAEALRKVLGRFVPAWE